MKLKLTRVGPGAYETTAGHQITKYGDGSNAFWAITWPNECGADVSRPTLRQAWEYVQMFPESEGEQDAAVAHLNIPGRIAVASCGNDEGEPVVEDFGQVTCPKCIEGARR